ncbi:MAG: hypothetical protein AB7S86_13335 [Hydrogenophaga sp.]|uniref:hypothetical protein n=1 Tax=Hydrogenophaga sp. TaxID=1904254 RepID=UPI003D113C61
MKTLYCICSLATACLMGLSPGGAVAATSETPPVAESGGAHKPQIWVNLGGFSRHFDSNKGYNENNLGLGLEYRTSPEIAYMAGAYYNSVRKTTSYAAVNWQPWQLGPVRLGAALGVMNGYPSLANGGSFFAALPLATIEGRHFGINFGLIPSIGKVDGAVIVQFKLRLN